jgi:hypothetical protein
MRPMVAPADEPEILAADAWPVVAVERQPNGKLGMRITLPAPPVLLEQGIDEIAYNIEPKRARRLRDHLTAHLTELGL